MIKILHLYYDLLNLYGEQGNILAINNVLKFQNVEYKIDYKSVNDKIRFNDYDLIYLGSGSDESLEIALNDIKKYKKQLSKYIDNNKYLIATGNSYLLFGKKIDDKDALGIFDFSAIKTNKFAGECIMKMDNLKEVIGFQNRSYLVNNIKNHLFKVIKGFSDNLNNNYEGIRINNFFGTLTFGPLLIRNPHLTNYIIKNILESKNLNFHEEKSFMDKAYDEYIKNFYE